MRRIVLVAAMAALLLGALAPGVSAHSRGHFRAVLSGADEVPARVTDASGTARFKVSSDGTRLRYEITVADIENVFAAHIHCGAPGVNAPIGVTLFMGTPGSGPFDGVLIKSSVTAPDPGNACGWTDLGAVIGALKSGNTYINVHTNDGVDPPDTGAGDFPGGEIRGQIF